MTNGLTALGDPTRRAIFERLAERPSAVGELADSLPVTRSAVSQHLKVLKDAGLVLDRAEGTRRIYQLDPAGVDAMRAYLDGFWKQSMAAFRAAAEGERMTAATDATSIRRETIVAAPIEHAFKVFTEDMGAWWDPSHHLVEDFKEMVVEPRVGGRITDYAHDGSTCTWSRVLAYDPPERFVFSWDINLAWQVETDPARASEVEVRFYREAPDRTRVTLEHKHLDRHGDGWEAMRDAVGSPNGWDLTGFAQVAASTA